MDKSWYLREMIEKKGKPGSIVDKWILPFSFHTFIYFLVFYVTPAIERRNRFGGSS